MRISDWSSDVCLPILFPQAAFSGVQFPAADAPYYAVQLRQPCEAGRAYGTTLVSVAAADGRIVDTVDPFAMSVGERAINLLYPIHTGEIGGAAGRIVVLSIGVWLATMIVLGFRLWLSRRPKQRRRKAPAAALGEDA